ncbi:hypothetical protein [Haloferula sp. BvORR071]|uniref:hypothetical protein n=1 Tax=Haloferula sp. BvORR071 TaxID=1396141 RepID=UPI002240E8A9|nr:hypothetical protein [Haloferula sp. BvORR071]
MTPSAHPHSHAVPSASQPLPRPGLRRSVGFWCGLMLLVFLLGNWAAGWRESQLFLFQTGGGSKIWALTIDASSYGLRLTRPAPLPPVPTGLASCDSVINEPQALRGPLGWNRQQGFGEDSIRIRLDHWLIVAAHLVLWGGMMGWRARRIARHRLA